MFLHFFNANLKIPICVLPKFWNKDQNNSRKDYEKLKKQLEFSQARFNNIEIIEQIKNYRGVFSSKFLKVYLFYLEK
jgi:hypothetical protein